MKVKEVIVTIVAGGLLVTGKGGAYVPLLLLLFLIPRENFGEKIKYPVVVGMAVFITIIVFLASNPSLLRTLSVPEREQRMNLFGVMNQVIRLRTLFAIRDTVQRCFWGLSWDSLEHFRRYDFRWLWMAPDKLVAGNCILLFCNFTGTCT